MSSASLDGIPFFSSMASRLALAVALSAAIIASSPTLRSLLAFTFKRTVHALPPDARYVLSLLAFWPTALFNRAYCSAFPGRRRLWDRVTPYLVLGSAPFLGADVRRLASAEGVRAVINTCREWDWHGRAGGLYAALGIRQLRLKTIDYDIPTLRHGLEGARFLAEAEAQGEGVYVHCECVGMEGACAVAVWMDSYEAVGVPASASAG